MNLEFNPEPLASQSAAHSGRHLSEEDLDEILIGIAEPRLTAHATACTACASRLKAFQESVGLFNQASLAWSQAKSNSLTRDLTTHHSRPAPTLAALWSYAAAALLAVSLVLTAGLHHHAVAIEAANHPAVIADSTDISQQEIASDNAMLQAIDSELYRPEPAPVALYEDAPVSNSPHSQSRQVRD